MFCNQFVGFIIQWLFFDATAVRHGLGCSTNILFIHSGLLRRLEFFFFLVVLPMHLLGGLDPLLHAKTWKQVAVEGSESVIMKVVCLIINHLN